MQDLLLHVPACWRAPRQEPVILCSVGSASANLWPTAIAMSKGFFAAEDLQPDLVFAQSNAAVNQQIAAGSVNFAINTGLVDPIRAIDKGAPAAIVRIEVQGPPYSLMSRPGIKSMQELKGKLISLGGAKDITRIFVERMLASAGVGPGLAGAIAPFPSHRRRLPDCTGCERRHSRY